MKLQITNFHCLILKIVCLFISETFGTRHFVTFMLFLGMANAYVMRTNMSVAIVAMVNHTFIEAGNKEIFDDECPDYGNSTTKVSITTDAYMYFLIQF